MHHAFIILYYYIVLYYIIILYIVYDLTDHLPNFIIFQNMSFTLSNAKVLKRDYSKLNELDLI